MTHRKKDLRPRGEVRGWRRLQTEAAVGSQPLREGRSSPPSQAGDKAPTF